MTRRLPPTPRRRLARRHGAACKNIHQLPSARCWPSTGSVAPSWIGSRNRGAGTASPSGSCCWRPTPGRPPR